MRRVHLQLQSGRRRSFQTAAGGVDAIATFKVTRGAAILVVIKAVKVRIQPLQQEKIIIRRKQLGWKLAFYLISAKQVLEILQQESTQTTDAG